ncbi:hypothetical protein D9Q98_005738 [Chlorella vulgaris]|uniref:Glutathione peroxidase n=1 Tax=Chlorella vulgaris TaxID=3077 RepID=A0A9D4YW88_CHLVU|nr:hypothetical protein D9Q98_005738 [Chlorella vulgaris]
MRATASSEHQDAMPYASSGRRQVLVAGAAVFAGGLILPSQQLARAAEPDSIFDLSALMFDEEVQLSKYRGQVLLVMNVAYDKYKSEGFNIIAFPCNQFGGQAPGTSQYEREWAWRKFGFEFDVFDKIEVNGPGTHPVYQALKRKQPGRIPWNYTKFLVDKDGVARKRYSPVFDPADAEDDIRLLLAGRSPLPEECASHPGRKVCKVDL